MGIDINFSGVNLNYTYYNGELNGLVANPGGNDLATESPGDKMKGGNIALGYNGELGGGKLAARIYYCGEESDISGPEPDSGKVAGWGLGALYNADKFFVGAEYDNITYTPEEDFADLLIGEDNNTQYGYYILAGVRFSSLEIALRYDFIDYSDIDDADDIDTEQWWVIGVNYLINDNTTLGVDYIWRIPKEPEDIDYPNTNEIAVNIELDVL